MREQNCTFHTHTYIYIYPQHTHTHHHNQSSFIIYNICGERILTQNQKFKLKQNSQNIQVMSTKRGISEISSNSENVDKLNKDEEVKEPTLKKQKQVAEEEAFSGVDIRQIINTEGPVVKCVMLDVNGEVKEIDVDMTPKKQCVTNLLGGQTSFVGQWEQIGVIVCCASQKDVSQNIEKNPHKLQPPFHQTEVRGHIILTRSGENGEPLDFKLSEYEAFQKLKIEEFVVEEQDQEEDDDEEEDEELSDGEYNPEDDEDDEEDDGFDGFIDMLLGRVVQQFIEKHGREPNHEEAQELEDALRLKLGGGQAEEEEEEEEETKEDEVAAPEEQEIDTKQVLDLLIVEFEKKNGRPPTDVELKQWIVQLKEAGMGEEETAEDGTTAAN